MIDPTTGLRRITAAFEDAKKKQNAAFMPYFTLGYPNRAVSIDVVAAIAPHAQMLELGVPFSDPVADGPTIQQSTQHSLEAGTTVSGCFGMVDALRRRGVRTAACLMGYVNPVLAYGMENYVKASAETQIDGIIIPDLPPEEADEMAALCRQYSLAYIYFLAPTSTPKRIKTVINKASGFIYMVGVTGVTGARSTIRSGLSDFVGQIKAQTDVPVAVGFGIGKPAQARKVGSFADGVIVGSAMITAYDKGGVEGAANFAKSMNDALISK